MSVMSPRARASSYVATILITILLSLIIALSAEVGNLVTVCMKNGDEIKGELIEYTTEYLKVKATYGTLELPWNQVKEWGYGSFSCDGKKGSEGNQGTQVIITQQQEQQQQQQQEQRQEQWLEEGVAFGKEWKAAKARHSFWSWPSWISSTIMTVSCLIALFGGSENAAMGCYLTIGTSFLLAFPVVSAENKLKELRERGLIKGFLECAGSNWQSCVLNAAIRRIIGG